MRLPPLLALLAACTASPDTVNVDVTNGLASVAFDVHRGDNALHVSAFADGEVALDHLVDPDGNVVLDAADWQGPQHLTDAVVPRPGESHLNWPVLPTDPEVSRGEWTAVFATDADSVDITITSQRDRDWSHGSIHVDVHVSPEVWEIESHRIDEALRLVEVRFEEVGVAITLKERPDGHDGVLADPSVGDDRYEASRRPGIWIGTALQSDATSAIAASPGPLTPTRHGAMTVGIEIIAEVDGRLHDDDTERLAVTIAQVVARWMGLSYVVQDDWTTFDAIADTPECDSAGTCTDLLAANLLFPQYSRRQVAWTLTPDQQSVLQRFVGIE